MKKVYNLIFLINMIVGFILFYSFLFVYETNVSHRSLIMVSVFLIYLISDIIYFWKNRDIDKIDIINMIVYIITALLIFGYSVYYQSIVHEVFSLVYFNSLLIVPHFLYIVYNVIRCYK